MLLCTVDFYSKFLVMKKMGILAADDLIQMAKMIFPEGGLPKKIVSDGGTNFISETFREFSRLMNIQQSITSSIIVVRWF